MDLLEKQRWELGHRPSLDALRGIAVLSVLGGHFGVPFWSAGGSVGVAVFFALSGYLITGILLRGMDFRRFYARRIRRLAPALLALVALVGLWSLASGRAEAFAVDAVRVLFYVANWSWIAGDPLPGLAHTWSLSVEEQFYLVWPIALWFLLRSGLDTAIAASVVVIVASYVVTALTLDSLHNFAGSDARAKDLLMGCLVALLAARRGADVRVSMPSAVLAVGVLVILAVGVAGRESSLLTGLPCAVILAWVAARPQWLNIRPLVWTGRISYGLYLYHYPLSFGAWPVFDGLSFWPRFVGLLAATYGLAAASWYGLERRFLV